MIIAQIPRIILYVNKNGGQKKITCFIMTRRFRRRTLGKAKKGGAWSAKYKRSIDCKRPRGFSQRQYCNYGRGKGTRRRRG
jgi:hypothetical protein